MRVVGLVVDIRNSTRPACSIVVVEGASGCPLVDEVFELTSADENLASQLHTLHASLGTRLRGLPPLDRAVVRRADKPPRPSNADGPRLRLLAEGAVLAAVRGVVPDTRAGAGLDLGRWYGSDKAGVDAAGNAAVAAASVGATVAARRQYGYAAAGALAGHAVGV